MEPLEVTLVDELLLDFSGDPPMPPRLHRHGDPEAPPPETALVEEDLEWLSNKDAFPTLDTSDLSAARQPSTPPSAAGEAPLPTAAASFFLRAPGRARSEGRRRRRQVQPPALLWPAEEPAAGQGKRRCWHCEAEETPQWRAGPGGPKTLCNACGVRYKSGRLVPEYRPANSPTFSGELHSNSHRKVMEMRRSKEGLGPPVVAAVAPAPAPAPAKEVKKKKRKKRQRVSLAPILSVQISAGNTLKWK